MAYTIPTAAEFKARFPVFTSVPDTMADTVLGESAVRVGAVWRDEDGPLGIMLLTAHTLTLDGHGPGAGVAGKRAAGVKSMASGSVSASFADGAGADASMGEYGLTSYGIRYYGLLSVNAGGPLVARVAPGRPSHLAQDWPY